MKADVRLMLTADGSHTAVSQVLDKPYHSIHGAVQESQRVYIELGLLDGFSRFAAEPLRIFELGFGTGLNALLTAREARNHRRTVFYEAIDAYPMSLPDALRLNYDTLFDTDYLTGLHESPWGEMVQLNPFFTLTKHEGLIEEFTPVEPFHLIYFDAFAPTAQPELWATDVFRKMARLLLPGGILTTYCSKSFVQRNLREAGFTVERHSGPKYKRNVLRAIRMPDFYSEKYRRVTY